MAPLQICTTASLGELHLARALVASIRRHEPDVCVWTLVADAFGKVDTSEGESATLRLLTPSDLIADPAELSRLRLIHGRHLAHALKPALIAHVLDAFDAPALFLDAALQLYAPLTGLAELIAESGVVLTPHALSPYPVDGLLPDDRTILAAGTYNSSVMGFSRAGLPVLQFLASRLSRECLVDPARMRNLDQRWLDLVPSVAPVCLLRDPGVNVGFWNLHERPLTVEGGRILAGGEPLRLFNFSGYDPRCPDELSRFAKVRPRVTLGAHPLLAQLLAQYREALRAGGLDESAAPGSAPEVLPGGIPIDETLRNVFRTSVVAAERQGLGYPPDPYDESARPLFIRWVELTYAAANLAVPLWATGSPAVARERHGAPVPTPASTGLDVRSESSGQGSEPTGRRPVPALSVTPAAPERASAGSTSADLLRQLAASSAEAFSNLDGRVRVLEEAIGATSAA